MRPGQGWKLLNGSSALMRHSMAWLVKLNVLLVVAEFFAGGDADLFLDDVDAGDFLGDRMLDLDAGVHLDEIEFARSHPAGTRRCRR